jgi:uncharacterized membrane protein YedE/YeeE
VVEHLSFDFTNQTNQIMDFILQPWPWYVVGPLIALTMFLLLYFGKEFGVSNTLRVACSAAGAQKFSDFFHWDWRSQKWNIIFVGGGVIGGFISYMFLEADHTVALASSSVENMRDMGLTNIGESYLPSQIFDPEEITVGTVAYLIVAGFLVGFGARYAGGCTSGHAISGLANLQLPSLIAVIGFFIGGMAMTYYILPHILPF